MPLTIIILLRYLQSAYLTVCIFLPLVFRRGESVPTLERATKFNPMFESEPVTAQYYSRYEDNTPQPYSTSFSTDSAKTLGSDEMQHLYQNSTLTKEVGKQ